MPGPEIQIYEIGTTVVKAGMTDSFWLAADKDSDKVSVNFQLGEFSEFIREKFTLLQASTLTVRDAIDEVEITVDNTNAASVVKGSGIVFKNTVKELFCGITDLNSKPHWTLYDNSSLVSRMRYDLTNDGLMVGSRSAVSENSTIHFNGADLGVKYFTEFEDASTNAFVGKNHGNGNPVQIAGAVSNGTVASPTIVVNGQTSLQLNGMGYDGSTYRTMGVMQFQVDGTPGSGNMPGKWLLSITPSGSTIPEQLISGRRGNVIVGNASSTVDRQLTVQSPNTSMFYIEADTNNDIGEENAELWMSTDAGVVSSRIAIEGNQLYFDTGGTSDTGDMFFRTRMTTSDPAPGVVPTVTTPPTTRLKLNRNTGILDCLFGITLTTTGGTPGTLDYYEEGSLTVDWEGPWATNQTNKTIKFTRIGRTVTLELQNVVASAGAGSVANIFLTSGDELPSRLRPTGYGHEKIIWTVDNGTYTPGTISIDLTGNIVIYYGPLSSNNFSGVGDTGFGVSGAAIEFTYQI